MALQQYINRPKKRGLGSILASVLSRDAMK
jgi:hypothetical protein